MKKLLAIMLLLPTLGLAKTIKLNKSNTINFNEAFSMEYVAKKQIEAILLCSSNIGSTINVVLYTPGGSVSAGQLYFDTLNALPCKFNTITIFSASMGYQTVQNLGKRYILPSGILMSHRARISGLSGEIGGELDTTIEMFKTNIRELETVASNRVGITLEEYRNQIRDELWMTGEQSVKMNHADQVVLAKCDKTLMGTSISTVQTFFGSFVVEYSDCPLIVGPLNVRVGNSTSKVQDYLDYRKNITKKVTTSL
jgi:ATP-dependent protease ClpP protease subunit